MAPTHDMFRDGLTLQKHVEKNAFRGMLMQIIDPVLLSIEEAMASSSWGGSSTMAMQSLGLHITQCLRLKRVRLPRHPEIRVALNWLCGGDLYQSRCDFSYVPVPVC
jgi:hypothetical protein